MSLPFTPLDWFGILSTILFIVGYFGYHLKFQPLKEHLDELFVLIFFIFGSINTHYILYLMRLNQNFIGDILALVMYLPIWAMAGLILIETGFIYLIRKMDVLNQRREKIINRLNEIQVKKGILQDLSRKFFHILYFFVIIGVSLLAAAIHASTLVNYDFNWMYWNIRPDDGLVFLTLLRDPSTYTTYGVLKTYLFYIFYIGTIIAIYLDWVRLSNKFWTLGRNLLINFARKNELHGIPSFIPIFTGVLPMAIILEPIPVFAIMITVIFADTAASQFGMRFGKHKISWNKKKSWEGTIAGGIVALITWVLVGPYWAIGAMIGFIISDLITETPLKISDNLLTPLLVGLIFLILTVAGVYHEIPYWFLDLV